jgi:photosystem II oxygen-evolving enhancer protein 2
MFKSFLASLLIILSLTLSGCTTIDTGLKAYSSGKGYAFLYPNGWTPVEVKNASEGVDVVFHDLIERSENLSVVISNIPSNKNLADIGSASEVGYRFLKQLNNNPSANRQAELIQADTHQIQDKTYYILEYQVKLPNQPERHSLASVAVSNGKLFTFNISTSQDRWEKVKTLFTEVVNSFSVY